MKKTKVLLTLACAILLVAASVMGTLAYLTSTDSVKNTFTVGDAVSITLDEAETDANGTVVGNDRVKGNTYKLMPGHTYTKDPTVHVKGETCYVFITVSNGISGIEAASETTTIAAQLAAKGWKVVDASKGLYVYATGTDAKTAVSKNTDLIVFSSFTVKEDADHAALEAVKSATIVINAYAVQKDGFEGNTPAEIWAATFGSNS